jgi:transcriptional regulator with XRE-family HTH domain
MQDDDRSALSLAVRLRRARQDAGLTQEQLAVLAGVKLDTLRAIEQGRTANPGVFSVQRLAVQLHVSIDYLAGGSASETPGPEGLR